jgi:endonuclease III related protein
MSTADDLHVAFDKLFAAYGPQGWWPGETPFEVAVGAILTQNTAWTNVEKAIKNLKDVDALRSSVLHAMQSEELAELIRPAGYYRLKAGRLKNFVRRIEEDFGGDFESMFSLPIHALREVLLGISGIGPETADSILLYAAKLPIFVVDNYTARIAKRHGWVDFEADYHQLQEALQGALEENVDRFNEYHALLVRVAKSHCKTRPICDGCPLECLLPAGGPLEPF